MRRPQIAVLASGAGSNLRAIVAAIDRGDLPATVRLVVSNNSRAGALAFARDRGIPAAHVSTKTHADPDAALLEVLRDHQVDVVVLAGYAKRVPAAVVDGFRGRIVNTHPAPLPAFGGRGMWGLHVHEAVLAAGVDVSGPTIHLVDEEYDRGRILAHRPVPVRGDDTPETLQRRVQAAEHDLYWRVLADEFCRTGAPPAAGAAPESSG